MLSKTQETVPWSRHPAHCRMHYYANITELAAACPCHSAATKGEDQGRILHGLTKPKTAQYDVCAEELALQAEPTL